LGGLLFKWLVIFVAVIVGAYLFPERISYTSWQAAVVFAGILGIFNMVLRPIVNFLALPLNCLTFGLFAVVINGFMFWLATQVYHGVTVASFLDAIIAALVVSVVSAILSHLLK